MAEHPLDARPREIAGCSGERHRVGVAFWSSALPRAQAAYLQVPDELRQHWRSQRARNDKYGYGDIMEVEAIGPLVLLDCYPRCFRGALWIHFVDNSGALSCLVSGSASVHQTDCIVGETWSRIAALGVMPWFDRVDTHSNPSDGLSRG